MTVTELQRLYDYGYWANRKLFEVASQLTPEQFTETVAGSYGSVRNTLVHILSAEWGWLERCGGASRGPALKPENYETLESVVRAWSGVERSMRELLSTLTDGDLLRIVEFTNPRGDRRSLVLGEVLQHGAIHGIHHRGQIALLLRALGCTPGNFDVLFYDIAKRSAVA
jgi:uncharacterized damage-inducible protein DinB